MTDPLDGWTFGKWGSGFIAVASDGSERDCTIDRDGIEATAAYVSGMPVPIAVVERLIEMWREKEKS